MLRSLLAALVFVTIAGSFSCGGRGDDPIKFTFRLIGSDPADGATDIPITRTRIVVLADRELDPGTIGASTVIVNEGGRGGLVQGVIGYDAAMREITWDLAPGQRLNAQVPTRDVFAFDQTYTISVSSGIRATGGQILAAGFAASFRTVAMSYSVVAAGSVPQPNASNALIDPERALVGGALFDATLHFQIDVALDPTSVTLTGATPAVHVESAAGGAVVPGAAAFDVATNTVFWRPDATANANPGFPGEPLLDTGTAYVFVLTPRVLPAAGGAAPSTDLRIPFTTGRFDIRAPRPTTSVADLVLNEILANPTNTADTNGDGVVNGAQDEFVEIVNISTAYLDLNGCMVHDATAPNSGGVTAWCTLTLPAGQKHRAMVAPGHALVVFGGGRPSNARMAPGGHSKVFVGTATANGGGRWNNGLVGNPAPGSVIDTVRVLRVTAQTTDTFMVENYRAPVPFGISLTRIPEITGPLGDHTTASSSATRFSPGLRADGTCFR